MNSTGFGDNPRLRKNYHPLEGGAASRPRRARSASRARWVFALATLHCLQLARRLVGSRRGPPSRSATMWSTSVAVVVQLGAPMVQVWLSRSSICARTLRHRES
jgi:hypothetical protein